MLRAVRLALVLTVSLAPLRAGAAGAPSGLAAALEAFVRAHATERVSRVELPSLGDLEADADGRRVTFSLSEGQPVVGAVPVGVSIWNGDTLEQKSVVTAQVSVSRPVVVARRQLASGSVIGAEDVAVEDRAVTSAQVDALSDPAQAVSHQLRRGVQRGEPLRAVMLTAASTVRRGDRVKLRLEHGALVIETAGRAEEEGAEGQWIRVRNLGSMREVLGRVGPDGVVHVEL